MFKWDTPVTILGDGLTIHTKLIHCVDTFRARIAALKEENGALRRQLEASSIYKSFYDAHFPVSDEAEAEPAAPSVTYASSTSGLSGGTITREWEIRFGDRWYPLASPRPEEQ